MASDNRGRSPYPLRNRAHNQAEESASAVVPSGAHDAEGEPSLLSSITDTPAQSPRLRSASLGSQDAPLTSTPRRRSQSISGEPRIRVPFELDADDSVVDDSAPLEGAPLEGFSPGDSEEEHRGQGIDPPQLHSQVDSVSYDTGIRYPVRRRRSRSLPARSDNEIDSSYSETETAEIDWTPEQHAAFEAAERELEDEQRRLLERRRARLEEIRRMPRIVDESESDVSGASVETPRAGPSTFDKGKTVDLRGREIPGVPEGELDPHKQKELLEQFELFKQVDPIVQQAIYEDIVSRNGSAANETVDSVNATSGPSTEKSRKTKDKPKGKGKAKEATPKKTRETHRDKTPAESVGTSSSKTVRIDESEPLSDSDRSEPPKRKAKKKKSRRSKDVHAPNVESVPNKTPMRQASLDPAGASHQFDPESFLGRALKDLHKRDGKKKRVRRAGDPPSDSSSSSSSSSSSDESSSESSSSGYDSDWSSSSSGAGRHNRGKHRRHRNKKRSGIHLRKPIDPKTYSGSDDVSVFHRFMQDSYAYVEVLGDKR